MTTIDRAKHLLALAEAEARGETIQYKHSHGWDTSSGIEEDAPGIFNTPERYRIAPKPAVRAWTADEVPVGSVIRRKGDGDRLLIVHLFAADNQIKTGAGTLYTFADLLALFTKADGSPCGTPA